MCLVEVVVEKMTYNQYTKKYIVDAFAILLENKNFSDITVKEIVDKAGVGRATFYRNFQDKEDVLRYKFQEIGRGFDVDKTKESISKEYLYYAIAKMLCLLKENKNLMRNLFRSNVEYIYFNFLNDSMKFLFETKTGLSNKFIHLGYSGALYNITKEWIIGDCDGKMIDVIDALFMVFTGGENVEDETVKMAMMNEAIKEHKV